MTEAELSRAFQVVVQELGALAFRNSQVRGRRLSDGRFVPVPLAPHERGRPDWTVIHPAWGPFEVELKGPRTRVSPSQEGFLRRFERCSFMIRARANWTLDDVRKAVKREIDKRRIEK